MENLVVELRNSLLQVEELKARKEAIKKLAREHRDTITDKELDENKKEIVKLNEEIATAEKRVAELQEKNKNEKREEFKMENKENIEKRSTIEYRKAFMDFVQHGIDNEILEKRTDAFTKTTDTATVIPETILGEIVKLAKISGNILPKVRKMNIKGGVKVPTLTLTPTASWIDEDTPSDRQKLTTGSVTFSYYGLEVKIAQSILSEYVSIEAFEREFAILAVEAMTNAKEIAIFNGDGSGKPLGILADSGVTSVNLTAENLIKYDKLVEVKNKLPQAYQAKAEWAMAQETWSKVEGMVDINGQPVARINYGIDGEEKHYLLGHIVNIVEVDRIKDVDTAIGSEYYMAYGQFDKYAINGNGDLGVFRYRDNDNNQDVTKALEILDGKLIDKKAFIRIKKGA